MRKALKIFSVVLLFGVLFTGCTPKKDGEDTVNNQSQDQSDNQSSAPMIDFEVPDKVDNYDFHYEFVPESE